MPTTFKLVVTHLSGPMKGQSVTLEDRVITIGRAPSAQVRFPDDFTAIGREHCEIHRDAGRYEIRVSTAYRVLVDGRAPLDGQELPHAFTLELGPRSDVKLQCRQEKDSAIPATDDQAGSVDDSQVVGFLRSTGSRIASLLALALLAVAVVIWMPPQRDAGISEKQVQAIAQELSAKATSDTFGRLAPTLAKSVMLVIDKSSDGATSPHATAWVAGPSRLATNAHVAESFEAIRAEGRQMYVRSPSNPPVDYLIERVELHPAYGAFQKAWESYDPTFKVSDGTSTEFSASGGYDVAVLYIASTSVPLPDPLIIADRAALLALQPGQEIASIGYPMEGLFTLNLAAPLPEVQRANITSLTDFFRAQVAPERSVLIKHSLPVAGGASGSPMFDNEGRVIGVVNGGNMIFLPFMGRTPSAAAVNLGQRADLLLPLLEGTSVGMSDLETEWQASFSKFEHRESEADEPTDDGSKSCEESAMIAAWLDGLSLDESTAVGTPLESDGNFNVETAQSVDASGVFVPFPLQVDETSYFLVTANSTAEPPIDIDLQVANNEDDLGGDFDYDSCPRVAVEAEAGMSLQLLVLARGAPGLDSPFAIKVHQVRR